MAADGKLRFRCPLCDKSVAVARTHAGKQGKCPGCGHQIAIPKELSSLLPDPEALFKAASSGSVSEVQSLLDGGIDINAKDADGMTPLHFAAGNNQREIVKLLVSRGAKLETKSNGGYTPLAWTVKWRKGGIEALQTLLELGADVNGGATPGNTPLDAAIIQRRNDMADLLRQHGANIQGQELMRRIGLT